MAETFLRCDKYFVSLAQVVARNVYRNPYNFLFLFRQPLVGQGLLSIEASRSHSHSHTPHSAGIHSTSDQPDAQHSQERDVHAPGGIRTRNPSKGAAADPRFRQRGHWDRNPYHIPIYVCIYIYIYIYVYIYICIYIYISVARLLCPTSSKIGMLRQNLLEIPNNIFCGIFFNDYRSFTCEETNMHGKVCWKHYVPIIRTRQKLIGPSFNVV